MQGAPHTHTHTHTAGAVKRKGFTIIQLVIGMLIFAILTGIAFFGISVYTAQANETRVASDLGTFEVAIKDYMLNNPGACSDGTLNPVGLNHYLTKENALALDETDPNKDDLGSEISVAAGVKSEAAYKKLSVLEDPWGHQYRVVIRNNADRTTEEGEYGAKGTDRAFIYVYSMGKDGKGAANDTKQDDSVLCVQYSDGEVYSRSYLPSDGKNQAVTAPAYTYWNKDENGKHSVMKDNIFAVGSVDPTKAPEKENGSGSGIGGGGGTAAKPAELTGPGAKWVDGDGNVTIKTWSDLVAENSGVTETSVSGQYSFGDDLVELRIPHSVTEIYATIPKSVERLIFVDGINDNAHYSVAEMLPDYYDVTTNVASKLNVIVEPGGSKIPDHFLLAYGRYGVEVGTTIKSVTLPNDIQEIGSDAFKKLTVLDGNTVDLSKMENLRKIGNYAFYESNVLEISDEGRSPCTMVDGTTKLPASLTYIGCGAFSNNAEKGWFPYFLFAGTCDQWNAISFGGNYPYAWCSVGGSEYDWNAKTYYVAQNQVRPLIECTDGDVNSTLPNGTGKLYNLYNEETGNYDLSADAEVYVATDTFYGISLGQRMVFEDALDLSGVRKIERNVFYGYNSDDEASNGWKIQTGKFVIPSSVSSIDYYAFDLYRAEDNISIYYEGTMQRLKELFPTRGVDSGDRDITLVIHCTDGDVSYTAD